MAILDVFKKKEAAKAKKAPAKKAAAPSTLKAKAAAPAPKKAATPAPAPQAAKSAAHSPILVRPLVTEKGTALAALNKYAFEVLLTATKNEVKKAVAARYGVHPVTVTVMVVPAKTRVFGRRIGKTSRWKKAIVTLKQGETIAVFEGV